jgi:hypothetical protein
MFAVGNLTLKYKRPRLPRPIRAHWALVMLGFFAMLSGLIGNIVLDANILKWFAIYFCVPMIFVLVFLNQVKLTKMLLFLMERVPWVGRRVVPFLKFR